MTDAGSAETSGPEIAVNEIALSETMKQLAGFVADVPAPVLVAETGARGTYAWTSVVLGAEVPAGRRNPASSW